MRALPLLLSLALACSGGDGEPADSTGGDADSGGSDGSETSVTGRCTYVNPFSQGEECKEYTGTGWDDGTASADCAAPMAGADPGAYEGGLSCDRDTILAECVVDSDPDAAYTLVFPGDDSRDCGGVELGCGFAGGTFVPSEVCEGGGGGGGSTGDVFKPFEQVCVDPVDGEPAGDGPDGQVCTWEAISGVTEEGRKYIDYASCEPVFSQRPYYGREVTADTAPDDPRLSDPDWVAEYDWVTAQVESAACVCCHSEDIAPDGPSGWYLEASPIWIDTLDDDGLAMMAGWVDSTAFGAFAPEDNNGFDRETTGVPTSDVARMQAFLTGELDRRGFTEADFADTAPFGGPLYDQLFYEPEACPGDVGVSADGEVTWTGGDARYLYVLEADSMSPGVPPNLDLPDGTLWRLDVAWTAEALPSGVAYGGLPDGADQAWPTDGAPPALVTGDTYYLYVLRDVYQPLTRCLFTAE